MERRANCTHISMVMVHGPYRCSVCSRRGGFGTLYRCSQDLPGFYSKENEIARIDNIVRNGVRGKTSIFRAADSKLLETRQKDDQPKVEFSSSFSQGLYSPEQREILLKQKSHVRASMSIFSHLSQTTNVITPSMPNSVIASSPDLVVDKVSQDITFARYESSFGPEAPEKSFQEVESRCCSLKICHHCRANFLERAWGRIDAIALLDPALLPPGMPSQLSQLNSLVNVSRGISPVKVVRNLGLRPPQPNRSIIIDTDLEASSLSSSPASSSSSRSNSVHHRFRQNLTRIFGGMLTSRRRSSKSFRQSSPKHEENHTPSRVSKKDLKKGDGAATTLQSELDEENLKIAAAVPLPGSENEDGSEYFGSGEVVLRDGVAVTEEAVGERMADITIL